MVKHEKIANGARVSSSDTTTGCKRTDENNRARGTGRAATADRVCNVVQLNERRSVASSQSSLGRTQESQRSARVRGSNGTTAGTSSVPGKGVGEEGQEAIGGIMKICAAVQQKGGVGKSNCIFHLAHVAAERGLKVLVIDLDTQGNATYTLQPYESDVVSSTLFSSMVDLPVKDGITLLSGDAKLANVENMPIGEAGEMFQANIEKLSGQFDLCLIDTAPALGVRMATALYVSGFVFSPIEMEIFSILGVGLMNKTIENMKPLNPSLQYLGLIPSRYNSRKPLQVQNFKNLKAKHPDLVAPVSIAERNAFGEAIHYQIPVWQVRKTAAREAAAEIRAFADYVFNKMEIGQ
tara:strand:+ start:21273 stop:22325 length:1053 start_codon:yes stop_codon:yes gene_type:complete